MRRILIFVLSLITACAAAPAVAQQRSLRIGFQTGEVNVVLSYAAKGGLFEAQKLDIKLVPFPAGPAMLPALAANEIDLAWMGEFPSVTGYSTGMPIEILMM